MSNSIPEEGTVGVGEAAAYLEVSQEQMRRLGDKGIIPMMRTSGDKKPGHRKFWTADLRLAKSLFRAGNTAEQVREKFQNQEVVNG